MILTGGTKLTIASPLGGLAVAALCLGLHGLLGSVAAGAHPNYSAAILKSPEPSLGYGFWGSGGMSDLGEVAGYRRISNDVAPIDQPVVWSSNGNFSIQSTPASYYQAVTVGFAKGANPVGNVRFSADNLSIPMIWEPGGVRPLDSPTGFGQAVSGAGDYIAGFSLGDGIKAIYWDDAGVHSIAGLEGRVSQAFSVNASGWYVGPSFISGVSNSRAAFVGQGGSSRLLVNASFPNTLAFDINDNNWVVGESRPGNVQIPFAWHDDEFVSLKLVPGLNSANATSINNDNTIVGTARNFNSDAQMAIAWFNGSTTPTDLNTLVNIPGATLIRAIGNNNAGQIFTEARLDAGGWAYYILTPTIPEPAMAGVALLAFAGSTSRRRRRR